jgi:serine O-acetyltransferase
MDTPFAGEMKETGPKGSATSKGADPSTRMSLVSQIAEDFLAHDKNPFEPGFWAVAVHRFGRWTEGVRPAIVKKPLDLAYRAMFTSADWLWGIYIPQSVKLGRRVRLWHHGCMWLTARSIGDDVHIRHNTTLGAVTGQDPGPEGWPVIGDRVQLGSGACVLGNVTVGDDSVVGANSVVLRSVPPSSRVMGIPARLIPS